MLLKILKTGSIITGLSTFLFLFSVQSFCISCLFLGKTIEKETKEEQTEASEYLKPFSDVVKKGKSFPPDEITFTTPPLSICNNFLLTPDRYSVRVYTREKYILYCRLIFYE